jgi:integrase/recombinase XerC
LETIAKFLESSPKIPPEVEDVRAFLRDLSKHLKISSQARASSALRNFFDWGLRHHDFSPKLLESVSRPKVPKRLVRTIDEDDVFLLIQFLKTRPQPEQLLFELLYGSGLRISEALNLRPEHFEPQRRELRIRGKRGKWRRVPLTPNALAWLTETFASNDALWPRQINDRSLRRWVDQWSLQVPLSPSSGKLHPHQLRHAIATHLLNRGASLPQIQKFLGHARLSTTEIYTHVSQDEMVKAYDAAFPKIPVEEKGQKS